MRPSTQTVLSLVVESLILAATAPVLYFPHWFPTWALHGSLLLLAGGWGWRRWRLGIWYMPTPADWPLFLLFAVILPISLWAAPAPLREQYSIPRASILLSNFSLFWIVVIYGSRSRRFAEIALGGFALLALAIALVAPLGMNWLYKFPLLSDLLEQAPAPLRGVFQGAEAGFHPNQVAGTLLLVLPLLFMVTAARVLDRGRSSVGESPLHNKLLTTAALALLVIIGAVFLLTQSRTALLACIVAIWAMATMGQPSNQRRAILVVGLLATTLAAYSVGAAVWISDAPTVGPFAGMGSLTFRREVWSVALQLLYGFPLTGIGLGVFRVAARLLYPLRIDPDFDLGHAHNLFLQVALDFGVGGLICYLAIYMVAISQLISLWQCKLLQGQILALGLSNRQLTIGLTGCLVAHLVFGSIDTVAPGAKTDFMSWFLLALILAMALLARNVTYRPRL